MNTEEKIDAIHDVVIQIKSDISARELVCSAIHKGVDSRIDGLHRVVKGNGQPGLEQKHSDLKSRFDKLETKVIVWSSIAIVIGQIIIPKMVKAVGW